MMMLMGLMESEGFLGLMDLMQTRMWVIVKSLRKIQSLAHGHDGTSIDGLGVEIASVNVSANLLECASLRNVD